MPAAARVDDERTPLIMPAAENAASDEDNRPLPTLQIVLLCLGRVTEGAAFFTIFPFVNQMIFETGVPEASVGFWSGWIESLFSLTQTILMLVWGRASDRYGRKPVLVISLTGMAVAVSLFGVARNVWQMIALRCLAGAFGGTVVTIRTMLSENSTPRTQARAFSWFAFAGNFPGIFRRSALLAKFPYLLPSMLTGCLTGTVALLNFVLLKETLPKQAKNAAKFEPMPILDVLMAPGVIPVLVVFQYASLLGVLFTALVPVFFFTKIDKGGFGFSPGQIAAYIAAAGFSQAFWLLLVFPPLQRRIGTGSLLRACAAVWGPAFAIMPLMNALLRTHHRTAFLAVLPFAVFVPSGVSMAFAGVQLALNDISPGPHALGTLNGMALSLMSAVRAVGPAAITTLFAFGVSRQVLAGYLAFVVLICIALGFNVALRWLPARAEGWLPPARAEAAVRPADSEVQVPAA